LFCAEILPAHVYSECTGQGTVGDGLGLRPEESNLTVSSLAKRELFLPREVSVTFHHWPSCTESRVCGRRTDERMRPSLHEHAGGTSDCGRFVSRRRNRSLHHPAYFSFVSFAL